MSFLNRIDVHSKNPSVSEAIGQSEVFLEFQDLVSQVAPINRPVLIIGERGTGKELAASRIHYLSERWQKPLITLNCAALTATLIGSELFGYEKGAFTGASARRPGRFEMASEGTLFLDEIGAIPMEVQEKILRAVEYGSFERVGSSHSITVDVRIVAATNIDLPAKAVAGMFKQDLLDRLSFEVIFVPPLRERKEDIAMLANHFAQRMAYELKWEDMPTLSRTALNAIESYTWPGNIRELKNVIERAVYKSKTSVISEICFNPFNPRMNHYLEPIPAPSKSDETLHTETGGESSSDARLNPVIENILKKPLKEAVTDLETYMLMKTLKEYRYHQKKTAKALGLTYDQFRGLKKRLGV